MAGLTQIPEDWSIGINDFSIRDGLIYHSGTNQNLYSDRSITVRYENSAIKNYNQILALLLRNDDLLTIKTFKTTGDENYSVGKASDIKYVARYIDSFLESVTSSSVATIPLAPSQMIGIYDTRFTDNNLGGKFVCRITNDGIQYLRNFTISGQTITLRDTLTNAISGITGLSVNDRFELINAYDVLKENMESYPVQGYVKKHVKPSEDCYISFTSPYDKPSKNEFVVIAYYELDNYKKDFIYTDSINHYELAYRKEELNFPVTQEQINYIESNLQKYLEPMISINLETYRPSKPQKGWKIPVNVSGLIQGLFTINSVSEKYIYPDGQLGKPVRIWNVKLSNYSDTLSQIISKLKRKNDLVQATLEDNKVISSIFKYNIVWSHNPNASQSSYINTPVALSPSSITANTFTANWQSVAGATGYKLRVSLFPNMSSFIDGYGSNHSAGNGTSELVNGIAVTNNTIFYYQVRAINDQGFMSEWSNVISFEKISSQFPESITVGGITTILDYGYIFDPQFSGDLRDYSSNNLSGVELIRRNSGDTFPAWVNDGTDWGLNFNSSTYGALKIPDSSNYDLNSAFTIIMVIKNAVNNANGLYMFKYNFQQFINADYAIYPAGTNQIYTLFATGVALHFGNKTEASITGTSKSVFSFSYDLINDVGLGMKSQYTMPLFANDLNNFVFPMSSNNNTVINTTAPMILGNAVIYNSGVISNFTNSNLKGSIYKFAIIKQKLSAEQIKEIHRILGY